jgi:hypothetical protein
MLNVFTCFFIIIGLYVDDLVIISMTYNTKRVVQEFAMIGNGKVKYCLGVQIKCD